MWKFNLSPNGHKKKKLVRNESFLFLFLYEHISYCCNEPKRMNDFGWKRTFGRIFSHWTVQSSQPRNPFAALGTGSRAQSGHIHIHTRLHTHLLIFIPPKCRLNSYRTGASEFQSEGERGEETGVAKEAAAW